MIFQFFPVMPVAFYIAGIFKRPIFIAGLFIQSVYILLRTIKLGRIPLVGPHDTLIFLSASIAAFSIQAGISINNLKWFSILVSLFASIFTLSAYGFTPHNLPLPPILKTIWFELHVVLSFLSYGLFGIGFILGIVYLKGNKDTQDYNLEGAQYKVILMAYCLFSLSMIFGGIWAYLAWGTYWLWTPKELWTTILWLFYSLYLHARLRQKWRGKPVVILGTVGFIVVLFTYLGVSLLMKSSHTF